MQAIMETLFDIFYLTSVITLGILMASRKQAQKQYRLFGIMAILLGFGDAFHLIPRAFALWTTGLENHAFSLGMGKLITSITMTIFYVILYHVWRMRYHITEKKGLTAIIYILAFLRIILCLCPQNAWTSPAAPLSWGIYRNIPFTIMGILIIILFYKSTRQHHDNSFKNMWLTILLSFGFYIPVVLFADTIPLMGMLMIPKTLAYLWTIWIGYQTMKKRGLISNRPYSLVCFFIPIVNHYYLILLTIKFPSAILKHKICKGGVFLTLTKTKTQILCALFAALIAIGAFLRVPVPLVPFTLQFLFTTLAGLLLGKKAGSAAVWLYVLLGLVGLPIFAEGGGISYIFKPTFGYLIGFGLGAYVTGFLTEQNTSYKQLILANFAGLLAVYLCGMAYYAAISAFYLHNPIGLFPLFLYCFLLAVPGDIVLCVVAAILAKRLIPIFRYDRR